MTTYILSAAIVCFILFIFWRVDTVTNLIFKFINFIFTLGGMVLYLKEDIIYTGSNNWWFIIYTFLMTVYSGFLFSVWITNEENPVMNWILKILFAIMMIFGFIFMILEI